ncbi:hydantoinase/oxoprolinase family protein [Methanolobus halotolerans]|uniref:Hydantoinase n=1 Tax=Methanolobus halotolerans TaxID=2052935 RepID=A0A4E0QSQ2_9EURY|nr:hydantoinase/oxoprolinase family protein [Methanolobus halotolerans]TGC10668.1 hydantoinase [Methanolobus halotolerans]
MNLGLGIDTGGTYTDAVIMDLEKGNIIDSHKSLTTYPDLIKGIENTLGGLKEEYLKRVTFTSVSTTLATNTTLEGKGYPAALIMIGYSINKELPTDYSISIDGGHDSDGNEITNLGSLEDVKDFVLENKNRVASFAISSYFGVRNPDHEIRVKEYVRELTDLPVVCGHELSLSLGAYERAVTALLNAQLIPVIDEFIKSISSVMEKKGIKSILMMMKCDGSLVKIEEALEKPVESIFSGPAASLVGAAHLTGSKTCIALDIGGTSTDIAMIHDGVPVVNDSGAVVGGWSTMVKAIKMDTSALGGDSHVWVQKKMFIGPKRVIPLCLAASEYPSLIDKLNNMQKFTPHMMSEIMQPTVFFINRESGSSNMKKSELDGQEINVLDAIGDGPSSLSDIEKKIEMHPLMFVDVLKSLIRKRHVHQIGFTPTDALHVLGEYEQWNKTASFIGADILSGYLGMSRDEFCLELKQNFQKSLALHLVSYFCPDVKKEDIRKLLEYPDMLMFKPKIPVVMVGAPVKAYAKELNKVIEVDMDIPAFYEVGNAVGALVGDVIYRTEMLIKPSSRGSSSYTLFSDEGRQIFEEYKGAVDHATEHVEKSVAQYMKGYGLNMDNVNFQLKRDDIGAVGTIPLETRFVGVAIGSPRRSV